MATHVNGTAGYNPFPTHGLPFKTVGSACSGGGAMLLATAQMLRAFSSFYPRFHFVFGYDWFKNGFFQNRQFTQISQ